MRLCNALIHYFLFLFLSLSISQCYGHEHHNHVDPVTTKYSQSSASIDPLSSDLDTTNVHKHNDDDHHHHHHDTIEARLRAKHNLRQSVHQHDDDDKHENEEDYINQLNLALEDNYKHEHQFQYAPPPIVDLINNTKLQNQTNENIQELTQIQNDTISSPITSTHTPIEEKQFTTDELTATENSKTADNQNDIQNLDDKSDTKVTLEESLPPLELKTDEQQNIIQEDLLFIHKETLSSTQSHLVDDIFDALKTTSTPTPPLAMQQAPSSDVLQKNILLDNSSLDIKSSTPTQLQPEDVKTETTENISTFDLKHQISGEISNNQSTESSSLSSDATQNTTPITPIKSHEEQQKHDNLEHSQHNTNSVTQDTLQSQDITPVQSSTPPSPTPSPTRILRSQTSKLQQRTQHRLRHGHAHHPDHDHSHSHDHTDEKLIKTEQEPTTETMATTEKTTLESTLSSTEIPISQPPIESLSLKSHLETTEQPSINLQTDDETKEQLNNITETQNINDTDTQTQHVTDPFINDESQTNDIVETQFNNETQVNNTSEIEDHDQNLKSVDIADLPRQVHIHDPNVIYNELKEESQHKNDQEIENNSTASSFLANDHSPHLPRILENEDTLTTTAAMIKSTTEINAVLTSTDSDNENMHNSSLSKSNNTDSLLPIELRQVCWHLPKSFEPGLILIENQAFRFVNLLPEYIQAIFLGQTANREKLMNTIWFASICSMCFFFSFIFLSMGAKRLKQSKDAKEIRARCQQLQQYNNQLELERATFEKQNQKLSDEIDELKNLPIRDTDEEIFDLREKYERLYNEWQNSRTAHDAALKEIDYKQNLLEKCGFEMQKQVETVASLNDEILRQKQELEKDRETIARLQSNDLTLERFENLQQTIQDLKGEISQLKQEKFAQTDELQLVQEQTKQLDLDNNQLTVKMKQLKDLLQQRDETINQMRNKMRDNIDEDVDDNNNGNDNDGDDDDDKERIKSELNSEQNQKELLSKIDDDVEKANQHLRDLHSEIDEKTRRIKELDSLLNQERDRCRELETKLKVVLELRERDAHLHIRQLGHTDAELRKARTDTERVRILQQQLHLKEQQLEDVQKVLNSEQTKFSEECSKLQHEIHEKWMEVKKLTRELDGVKKECESLRRQISKYANNDRSSQEKTMHKPVPQHMNTSAGRVSSEPETNGNSPPPPIPYQQGDNFRPIDHERNDSGAASPSELFRMRPPLFGLPRPPFYPPPFLPPPPPNPFMMGARFPMQIGAPHGMISPIPHLMTNGSGGGSDTNSFEIVDSANITPNSISYDAQLNGSAASPTPDGDPQATAKVKKPKKSLKKKSKTSGTTVVASAAKEDV